MFEAMIQMGPMLIVAAILTGWWSEAISPAGGYGLRSDMVAGLAGSIVGGVAMWVALRGEPGMLAMFAIGCGSAALVIVGQRIFWRSAPAAT